MRISINPGLKLKKSFSISVLLILFFTKNSFYPQNYVAKRGGICFRVDDNHPIEKFQQYAQIFDKYNQKFCFALNLSDTLFHNESYKTVIKSIQDNGHELMDHTPNHRTNYFITQFPLGDYKDSSKYIEGIDHIKNWGLTKRKVCLEFAPVDTNIALVKGKADIIASGDSIYIHNYSWPDIGGQDIFYLYFPEIDTIIYIPYNGIGSKQPAFDVWGNKLNISNIDSISYFGFQRDQVHLTIDAIKILTNETQKLAQLYGYEKPKSWIQPGGIFPLLHKEELKAALGNNYSAGAVYPQEAKQVFNEYNPSEDLNFAMQWGDFLDDEKDFKYNIRVIAQNYAKHYMLIGHSHFEPFDSWDSYLKRTDSLVAWAVANNIPIKTYSEWADILYNETPDPYQNIFPPLNVDLDTNGIPDGYGNLTYPIDYYEGILETDPEAPSPGNYCYRISKKGGITYVQDLGGIEKGKNNFEIWTKGETGDSISVIFEYSYSNRNGRKVFKLPANTANWTKYNLSNSTNGNTELNVPDTMSSIFVYIECSDYASGDVKISGMSLSKFIEPQEKSLNARIFLEGAYINNDTMQTNQNALIPKDSPYLSSPKSVSEVPENIVDWVLVELRDENDINNIVAAQSAFVDKNGYIVDVNGTDPLKFMVVPGKYYIVVKHRNHLTVMSNTAISL